MEISDLVELEDLKDLITEGKVDSATSGVLTLASKYPENREIKQLVTLVSTHMVPHLETPQPEKKSAFLSFMKIFGKHKNKSLTSNPQSQSVARGFDRRMSAAPLAHSK